MKLGIVGSRDFKDYLVLKEEIEKLPEFSLIDEIISGGAKGADKLGVDYAKDNKIPWRVFYPKWRVNGMYDHKAGFKRNSLIVEHSDIIIAFWDGRSGGTLDTIKKAEQFNKKIHIIYF